MTNLCDFNIDADLLLSLLFRENDLDGEEDHDLNNTVNGVEELRVTGNQFSFQ